MNLLQIFGYISALLSAICIIPYVIDILAKKSKPERATWLIFSVLGGIAFFSQLAKGATDSLWMPGVQTLAVFIIFILSLKYGVGGLGKRDKCALLVALLGLLIWYFTKEAAIALYLVIIVDFAGALLTIIKAYEDPASETMSTWILSGLGGLFSAFAVGEWNLILLSYPIYIFIINYVVVAAMLLGSHRHHTSKM